MRVNNEDAFEAQPLRDREADLTLVADCRIDNREELAKAFGLSADQIRDMPDSAFILRAYKKWGENCAEHLLGDFAFAVWDAHAKKLVLGRDHMGQRNVFYHKGPYFFVFATEIKALWAVGDVPRALLDAPIGRRLLKMRFLGPEGGSLFRDVFGLTGATVLRIDSDGTTAARRYWEPRSDPKHEKRDEGYYIEKYRSVLTEAVACRLRRLTKPAALMMSAGYDTGAIAGLAGPTVAAQGRKLISISSVVSEGYRGTKWDIRPWVEACRRVMPHLDVRYLSLAGEPPFAEFERRARAADGLPASVYQHRLFAEAVAGGARLVMDGYGGDYTLNPRGHGALARLLWRGKLRLFLTELGPHMRVTGQSLWGVVRSEIIAMLLRKRTARHIRQLRGAVPTWEDRLIQREFRNRLKDEGAFDSESAILDLPPSAMMAQSAHTAAHIARGIAAGLAVPAAAHGLELTRPFHDRRVVELGLSVPEDLYVKNGRNRYIACVALRDVYPPEFQTRGRENMPLIVRPDNETIMQDAEATLLEDIDRLERNKKLSTIFDFDRARRHMLFGEPLSDSSGFLNKAQVFHAIRLARFIEWFVRSNRE
jgi:asparagine synthase (glutamine-hydrolysing)